VVDVRRVGECCLSDYLYLKLCTAVTGCWSGYVLTALQWSYDVRDGTWVDILFYPLECIGNYSATSNIMKLVHWLLMGGLLHLVQRGGDLGGARPSPSSVVAVPNVTAPTHQRPVYIPITVFLYNDTLICGFNVPDNGLKCCIFSVLWHVNWTTIALVDCVYKFCSYSNLIVFV